MELFPDAGLSPRAEVVKDRRPGAVIAGQIAPGTAAAHEIEQTVQDPAHIHRARALYACRRSRTF